MDIGRIVIEKKVLDAFKRRAFKAFPKEHIEAILGRLQVLNDPKLNISMYVLHVFAFDNLDKHKSAKQQVDYSLAEEELEAGSALKYYGTLHTHPKTHLEPSKDDWKSFLEVAQVEEHPVEGYYNQVLLDEVMGIMYIEKKAKQKFYGIAFYNRQGDQIEVIISEQTEKK